MDWHGTPEKRTPILSEALVCITVIEKVTECFECSDEHAMALDALFDLVSPIAQDPVR